MTWSHDEAAQIMGMAPHEILAVAEVGDVHVVTTHDGQHTVVTDDGEVQLLTSEQADKAFAYAAGEGETPPVENGEGEGDDELPDGDAKQILAWVGEDAARAVQALEFELAKEKPRTTLVASLQKVAQPA